MKLLVKVLRNLVYSVNQYETSEESYEKKKKRTDKK